MTNLSPALKAALRALHGESDVHAVYPAIVDPILAPVIALAPDVHPVIRAVAALFCKLPTLIEAPTIADPSFHDVVARLIGTSKGRHALHALAEIAPAGWGAIQAHEIIAGVRRKQCLPDSAAALIGPCTQSARLLRSPDDIAFAIRRWGQSTPETPTAWMSALSAKEQNRLLSSVQKDPRSMARCLPWLPPDMAHQTSMRTSFLIFALDAFVDASPTARTQHADILQRLVKQAHPELLGTLTHLACAMGSDDVCARVATLIRASPDDAVHVVTAAPWEDIAVTTRAIILENAGKSDICAAVAAAQGRTSIERITHHFAAAFFAALDPMVWDTLPSSEQRRWRDALPGHKAHLAVRSLGLRPEFLAITTLDHNLVHAVRRHTHDAAIMREGLLPVALRNTPPETAHAIITVLPPPPDPGAFFSIVGKDHNLDRMMDASAVLRSQKDMALAITLQRCADYRESLRSQCMALHDALRERSGEDLEPFISLLGDDVRNALMLDADALVERLAHPDRRDALRQTLARLTSLPLVVAIPTQYALHRWGLNPINADDAATVIAFALRGHGDVFWSMLWMMNTALRCCRCRIIPLKQTRCARWQAMIHRLHTDWRAHWRIHPGAQR